MKTLIENARLIDPASGLDRKGSLAVADGRIAGIDLSDFGFDERIDAQGAVLAPGLVDLHARLRCSVGRRSRSAEAARSALPSANKRTIRSSPFSGRRP